ncbi:MAG: tRNA preQ1(34) S-adenosylmethionine ribosyltransferase-isomerase QueA, partial [Methyloligellaceae bacterium]
MRVDAFDFELPADRIALRPVRPRDIARLLAVDPGVSDPIADCRILDLPELLSPGDALVFNDTKVIPARLTGRRVRDGAAGPRIEVTLHRRERDARWRAFARPARKLAEGDGLVFGEAGNVCLAGHLAADVVAKGEGGEIVLAFEIAGPVFDEALDQLGQMPLPPYIASRRPPDTQDVDDYQTVFAQRGGAVAAPTAGLHFTERLLAALEERGVSRHLVTLHVGAGTFLPVKVDDTADHRMHGEWGEVSQATAEALNRVREAGRHVVAVGSTAVRLLESAMGEDGRIGAFEGETDIFITPGCRFRAVDRMLTNFHLPRSTLFMLVAAFSGLGTMQRAYAHAIDAGYRFYSYGDACLLSP